MAAHQIYKRDHHTVNVIELIRRCLRKKLRQFFGDIVGVVILPKTEYG